MRARAPDGSTRARASAVWSCTLLNMCQLSFMCGECRAFSSSDTDGGYVCLGDLDQAQHATFKGKMHCVAADGQDGAHASIPTFDTLAGCTAGCGNYCPDAEDTYGLQCVPKSVYAGGTDAAIGAAIGYVCGVPQFSKECTSSPLQDILNDGSKSMAAKGAIVFTGYWLREKRAAAACDFGGIAEVLQQTRGVIVRDTCDDPCYVDGGGTTVRARKLEDAGAMAQQQQGCATCRERLDFAMNTNPLVTARMTLAAATDRINEDCDGQCSADCNILRVTVGS